MDFHLLEFEIVLHYPIQILVIRKNKVFLIPKTYFYCSSLVTRNDESNTAKSMRNWLQRSQSHNEVTTDDVADEGRYHIS